MGTLNRPGSSDSAQYEVGDQVRPGQIFMKIMETDSMQLACAVNHVEARLIEIGQRARVPLDAYPGLVFQGKLLKIGAMAVRGRREDVLVLPLEAPFKEDDQDFVHVKTGEGSEKHRLHLGSRSNTHAEVLSGLSMGQEVATVLRQRSSRFLPAARRPAMAKAVDRQERRRAR
jgi:hypothetical protein